jgi:uncharacterized membrane protein
LSTRPGGYGIGALAVVLVSASCASAGDGAVTDADVLAIARKHCVMCHAVKPTHEAFREARMNVTLKTIGDMKTYAQRIYVQTVQNKAMSLGNQTGMTEAKRAALGRWVWALP